MKQKNDSAPVPFGFREIPGFPGYVINREGVVLSAHRTKVNNWEEINETYGYTYALRNSEGKIRRINSFRLARQLFGEKAVRNEFRIAYTAKLRYPCETCEREESCKLGLDKCTVFRQWYVSELEAFCDFIGYDRVKGRERRLRRDRLREEARLAELARLDEEEDSDTEEKEEKGNEVLGEGAEES